MNAPRPTSDLAADVRRFLMQPSAIVGYETTDPTEALDALVARITDLEAVYQAARGRVADGHSSGCKWYRDETECECGHEALAAAVRRVEGE